MLDPVSRVRRFNRAVTSAVGALDTSFLGRGRPLGAARVLNAIGHGRSDVAEIRDYLGLDSGLMSRLLRSLEDEGLIETEAHQDDARRRVATLTRSGRREFAAYEALSNAQAEGFLAQHSQREALLAAMDLIASTLTRERIALDEMDPQSDEARYCLGGTMPSSAAASARVLTFLFPEILMPRTCAARAAASSSRCRTRCRSAASA